MSHIPWWHRAYYKADGARIRLTRRLWQYLWCSWRGHKWAAWQSAKGWWPIEIWAREFRHCMRCGSTQELYKSGIGDYLAEAGGAARVLRGIFAALDKQG